MTAEAEKSKLWSMSHWYKHPARAHGPVQGHQAGRANVASEVQRQSARGLSLTLGRTEIFLLPGPSSD